MNEHRGQYTERNAGLLPWLGRCDLSVAYNLGVKVGESKNTIQLRMDVTNFGNMLSKNWGVGQRLVGATPLAFAGLGGADGKTPVYRFNTQAVTNPDGTTSTYLIKNTYVNSNSLNDVYQIQFGLRYIFN